MNTKRNTEVNYRITCDRKLISGIRYTTYSTLKATVTIYTKSTTV